MEISKYGYGKKIDRSFQQVVEKTKEELKKEGFGVLTEIDIKNTLKTKIDVDMNDYTILGACHPESAYKSIQSEVEIGLMLPCNIVVYQNNGGVVVSAIKPSVAMGMIENNDLGEIAADIEHRLKSVIDNV